MNKLIKSTSKITNPNVLLNKFIIFNNNNIDDLFLHYVYKTDKENIFSYRITYNNNKIVSCILVNFNIENYNFDIHYSLQYNYYNVYIF